MVLLHGIQSHAGWYEHTCTRLARAGFGVSSLDRRGSGRNPEARGDALSFRRLLDDVGDFLRPLRAAGRRVVLVGVSWGGKLAAALPRRHPGLIDGLALVAPGFCPRVAPPLRDRLRIAWARVAAPARRFPIPLNDPDLFTATPRWRQFLRDDPLALHEATARFFVESLRLDGYVRRARRRVTVPVLLQLAGRDRIIDNDRTRRFVAGFASPDVTVKEYPDAHHTLEFEPDPDPMIDDLIAWLRRPDVPA